MSNIKFKKLTLQYAYLILEQEEVDEICSSTEGEIRAYIEEHYPEYYRSLFETPATHMPGPREEETEEIPKEDHQPAEPKNKDLKKLYRRIAEKTHPDKVGNNKHTEVFSKAARAYANNDLAALLDMAARLNIELSELSQESLDLLEKNIKTLSEGIFTQKSTSAWAWHHAKSDEEKKAIIEEILKLKGVQR